MPPIPPIHRAPPSLPPNPRVAIVGSSGSGKSTLARALSRKLGVPHIELDAFRHGPNWTETPDDVFAQRADAAADPSSGWIADGNYTILRPIIWRRASAIVWLDYPFPLSFARLFARTVTRAATRQTLWNGNRESLYTHFFTRDSLFLWNIRRSRVIRRQLPLAFAQPEHAHLQVIRFARPKQTRQWLDAIPDADAPAHKA